MLIVCIMMFGLVAIVGSGGGDGGDENTTEDSGGTPDGKSIWYGDIDGDGYGDPNSTTETELQPVGYVGNNSDCDDSDENTHPGASEICNDNIDNDCDGEKDCSDSDCAIECNNPPVLQILDILPMRNYDAEGNLIYIDFEITVNASDFDGDALYFCWNTEQNGTEYLGLPNISGLSATARAFMSRGKPSEGQIRVSVSDGIEKDSRLIVFDRITNGLRYTTSDTDIHLDTGCEIENKYIDNDNDLYLGNIKSNDSADCDDNNSSIHPNAEEICEDGIDQDCNGVDRLCPNEDNDGDGYTENQGDCKDNDATISPGIEENCSDSIDNDCDGLNNCDDPDCSDDEACFEICNDGIDNNGNGFNDCDDPDCFGNPECEICNDGIDNNGDGLDDCADPDCLSHPVCNSITKIAGMTFNLIPAGTFAMGSPTYEPGRGSDEIPYKVTLTQDFYMQTTEVTRGQWEAIITAAETANYLTPGYLNESPSTFKYCGEDCPVTLITWHDIEIFISALNKLGEGTYSLPTEAQWEYAARAGSKTAFANGPITEIQDGVLDPNLDDMGWYNLNSAVTYLGCNDISWMGGSSCAGIHPVSHPSKKTNSWGLSDMHGNVYEWCQDWYGEYPTGSVSNPTGPTSGNKRVYRGGSWWHYASKCRSAYRASRNPDDRCAQGGFRLVLLPTQ